MPADIDVTGKTRGGRQIWLKVLDSYLCDDKTCRKPCELELADFMCVKALVPT
jgi:hypothetical protein